MPIIYTQSITFHCCVSCLRFIFWCLQAATKNLRPSRLCLVRPWAWTSRCGVPRGPRVRGSKRLLCFVREFSACSKSANVENKFTDQLCELIFVSFIHLEAMQPSNAFQASYHFCGLHILKFLNLKISRYIKWLKWIQHPSARRFAKQGSVEQHHKHGNGMDFSWRQGLQGQFVSWDEPRIAWHCDTAWNHKVTMTCEHRLSQLILQLALIFAIIPLLPQHNLQVQVEAIIMQ